MDELTTTCYRCGAQGATKYVESLNAWVHHDMRRCVSALRANAKAAERRVAELEARLEIVGGRADDMAEWWKVANDDAERLRIRAAELEARLRLLSVTG